MWIDKEAVAHQLREQGDHDRAQAAACALPRRVETHRDAALLHAFDVSVGELESREREHRGSAG